MGGVATAAADAATAGLDGLGKVAGSDLGGLGAVAAGAVAAQTIADTARAAAQGDLAQALAGVLDLSGQPDGAPAAAGPAAPAVGVEPGDAPATAAVGAKDAAPEPEVPLAPREGAAPGEGATGEKGGEQEGLPPGIRALEAASLVPAAVDLGVRTTGLVGAGLDTGAASLLDRPLDPAQVDAQVRASLAPPNGDVVPAGLASEEVAASRGATSSKALGWALQAGDTLEGWAEAGKGFLENKLVAGGTLGLGMGASAIVAGKETTAQTIPGQGLDVAAAAGVAYAVGTSGPVGAVDGTLTLITKYLGGASGEALNRAAGGWLSGNVTTGARAIITLGEAIATGDNTGIDEFNRKALAGDYGVIFQYAAKLGNLPAVRNTGANAIEAAVNAAKTVGSAIDTGAKTASQTAATPFLAGEAAGAALRQYISGFFSSSKPTPAASPAR
jgi:hypothetical protein